MKKECGEWRGKVERGEFPTIEEEVVHPNGCTECANWFKKHTTKLLRTFKKMPGVAEVLADPLAKAAFLDAYNSKKGKQ